MTILNAGSNTTLSLPVGQVAKFNGTGLVQVVPPVPQGVLREAVPLFAGRQTVIGPFAVAVTLFLSATGSAVEYFATVPVAPLPPQAEPAYVIELASLAALQSLALAGLLDPSATYIDTTTGQKYWATNGNTFLSAGANLDSSNINWVQSGLLPPASGTIAAATLSAGVAYVEGNRVALTATPLLLTATRDNYIDLRRDGTVIVTPVTVSAAAPAIPVNSMRLGFCRTDATNVTARTIGALDSLGNWMFNTSRLPGCKLRNTGTFSGFGGTPIAVDFTLADVFDNAGMHSTISNTTRVVFPSPGLYSIQASVQFTSAITAVGAMELACYVSNLGAAAVEDPTFPKDTRNPGTTGILNLQTSGTVLALAAGDYAEVYVLPNGASGSLIAAWLNCAKVG